MENALALVNNNSPFSVVEEVREQENDQKIQEESKEPPVPMTKEVMFDEDVSIRSQDDFSAEDLEEAGLTPPPLLHS